MLNEDFLAINKKTKNKALFLDRDGAINTGKSYVSKIEDFEFQPGIFELIASYQEQKVI